MLWLDDDSSQLKLLSFTLFKLSAGQEHLDEEVNKVYMEQLKMGWSGLSSEVEEICEKIGIKNLNEEFESKEKKKMPYSTTTTTK